MADVINYIVIDSLGIIRADTDLDEAVENPKCLSTAIGAVLDLPALRAVKRRPIRMARPLVDHGFLDG
jgi:hypothetical protein